ncbi:hypothetical protein [Azospirillum argentinense]|uniref:glycosyltransferase family 2 protein n=1 Tax=Azospirillum argentinense TaxID=2970906 RepID=UPI00157B950E|nr:glycosyltransferase [Azospirillum brasilense]
MSKKLVVCVCTYRRPKDLHRTLLSLEGLTFNPDAPLDVEVLVVDNDPARSAEPLCREMAQDWRFPIRYAAEPVPGIPAARNRCLDETTDADLIAFIDDDEVASPGWLDWLVTAMERTGAAVVAGPVLPIYEKRPPDWLTKGRFHDLQRMPTGSEPAYCATGNVLFRRSILKGGVRFDPELSLSGGSDVLFFEQIRRQGHRIVWCDEATIEEHVPASRMTARWILRRAFRLGTCVSLTEAKLNGQRRTLVKRSTLGLGHIALNLAALPLMPMAMAFDTSWPIRRLQKICVGSGYLYGLMGFQYLEYKR